jgi:hypothetical protein
LIQNESSLLYFIARDNLVYRRNEGPKSSFRDIAESNNALGSTELQYLSPQLEPRGPPKYPIPRQHRDHEKGKKILCMLSMYVIPENYDLCPRKDAILALFLVKLSKL